MTLTAAQRRAITAIVIVNFVTVSGFGLMFPVYAKFGNTIGATATELSWAIAAFSLGQLIAAPITGRLSDHYGRRPVLIVSLLLGSLAYLGHSQVSSPALLIAARFTSGLASGGFAVAFAVAADLSARDNRARVMGIVGAGFSAGIILGPALGGIVGSLVSEGSPFVVVCIAASVMNLLAAAASALLLPETRRRGTATKSVRRAARRALFRRAAFLVPVLVGFGAMSAVAMMEGTFVVYAERVLSLSSLQIGLTFAIMGLCSVLVQATAAGRLARRFGEYPMLLGAMVVQFGGLLVLGSFTAYPLVVIGAVSISVGYALLTPAVNSLASFAADDDTQGIAQGAVQGVSSLGRVLGPAAAGPIYDGFGATAPYFAGAAQLLLVLLLAFRWRLDRDPAQDLAAVETTAD